MSIWICQNTYHLTENNFTKPSYSCLIWMVHMNTLIFINSSGYDIVGRHCTSSSPLSLPFDDSLRLHNLIMSLYCTVHPVCTSQRVDNHCLVNGVIISICMRMGCSRLQSKQWIMKVMRKDLLQHKPVHAISYQLIY